MGRISCWTRTTAGITSTGRDYDFFVVIVFFRASRIGTCNRNKLSMAKVASKRFSSQYFSSSSAASLASFMLMRLPSFLGRDMEGSL